MSPNSNYKTTEVGIFGGVVFARQSQMSEVCLAQKSVPIILA